MDPIENVKKSKIIPKLLFDQVQIAEHFLSEVELIAEERLKFKFLTMAYANFIKYKHIILLKDTDKSL